MPWTEITRPHYVRDGLRYASDLTDAEWKLIEPLMPPASPIGRPRKTDLRAVVNAILYLASTGCQWRQLPKDFPPYSTVQGYFYDWSRNGLFVSINHMLVMASREKTGREASPTAARSQPIGEGQKARYAALMQARKSRAASAISSPTPRATWSACRFMRPTSRIGCAVSVGIHSFSVPRDVTFGEGAMPATS